MTLYVEFKKYENAKTTTRLFREVTKVLLREDGGALKHLKITVRRLGPEYIKGVQEDVKGAEAAREALEPLRQLKNIELSVTAQEERYRGGACLLVEEVGEAWVAALKKEVAAKTPESLT